MRYTILASAIVIMTLFCEGKLKAQSAYSGSYSLISGYTTGSAAGLFGYGTATVTRKGVVAYSCYYPYNGLTGYGSGMINGRGVFSLNNGTSGSAQIYSRSGFGSFADNFGSGYFGLGR